MWQKIKPVLGALFTSKKFLAMLAGILVWLAGKGGLAITSADVTPVLLLIATYVGAQGVADLGKSSSQIAAEALGKSQAPPSKE